MTLPFFKHILEMKVFVPMPARTWEIIDLPFSKNLHLLLKTTSYKNLEELMGKEYGELFEFPNADSSHLKELFKVLQSLTSIDGFRTVEFQVSVARQKRMNEHKKEISTNQPNTEKSDQNQITEDYNISEDLKSFLNNLDNENTISSEFKDILAAMEIDESSDFLQLKPEQTLEEDSTTGIIFIPLEYREIELSDLDLSIRLYHALRRLNFKILGDLHERNLTEIGCAKNCGQKSLDELCSIIEKLNGIVKRKYNPESEKIVVPEILNCVPSSALKPSVKLKNIFMNLEISQLGDFQKFSLKEIKATVSCSSKIIDELKVAIEKFTDENWREKVWQKGLELNEIKKIVVAQPIKDISVNCFILSMRLKNVLQNLNVEKLVDLENYSIRDFLRIKNFGRKTLIELREFVQIIERATDTQDLVGAYLEEIPSELDLNGLLTFINKFLDELNEREREILLERFGGVVDGRIITLEELGTKFSVTRERVRQIESKNIKLLQNRLTGISENALEKLKFAIESAICPLNIRFLTHLTNNDYDLFIYPPNIYLQLIKKLAPEIAVLPENQSPQHLVGNTVKLSKKIKSILDEEIHFLSLAEVFERLYEYQNLNNLALNDFFEAVQSRVFIIENGDTPDVLLISTDKNKLSMTEMAWQVLKDSDRALLPEEIIEEAQKLYGTETEFHSARSLANLPSYDSRFYLLDKRTIGLRQHFRLLETRWIEVLNDFQKVLLENQKPISTTDVVNNKLFVWTYETTPAEVTAILREDTRFKDLGRFLFALTEWEIEGREPIKELIIKVLWETDDALIATEIGKRIQKYRSVSVTSMPTILRNLTAIRSFEFGYYGLKTKGDYHAFFASDKNFLKRLVKTYSPIKFGDLCRKIKIDNNEELAELTWQTLQTIPQIRFETDRRSHETILSFNRWQLKTG